MNYKKLHPKSYLEYLPDASMKIMGPALIHDLYEFEKKYQNVYDFTFTVHPSRQELIVTVEGLLNWDKKIHRELCDTFHLKLYSFERKELYVHEDYEKILTLTYIPVIYDYKEVPRLNWEEFSNEEPSNINYNEPEEKILKEIEKLNGEYREAIREYGIPEEYKEYYKHKLEALQEITRRII